MGASWRRDWTYTPRGTVQLYQPTSRGRTSQGLVSLILSIGMGHGGPAPAALPFFVGLATLILPYLVASQMKQSKDNQYKDIADEEELGGV